MVDYEPKVGLRVKVFVDTEDGEREYIGLGTIVGEEPLFLVDKKGNVIAEISTPKIRLDNGKELLGLECWWIPKEVADKAEIEEFGKIIFD